MNLIYVNWEKASRTFNYMGLADRIEPIGIYIAELINFMVDKKLASLDDIHLIGWSLGAHAVGHAGKNVKNGKLQKIIGSVLYIVGFVEHSFMRNFRHIYFQA